MSRGGRTVARLALVLTTLLVSALRAQAAITLPAVIGDHMVLQQGDPVIWGGATPGTRITASLAGASASGITGPDGRWSVTFHDLAPGGPHEMRLSGDGDAQVRDVLVGEVWIGAGQSNMLVTVGSTTDGAQEAARATGDRIRMFVVESATAPQPLRNVRGTWTTCTRDTLARLPAVPWYFARDLRAALDVPVGVIVSAWSATPIDVWLPPTPAADGGAMQGAPPRGTEFELSFTQMRLLPKDRTARPVPLSAGPGTIEWRAGATGGGTATFEPVPSSAATGRFTGVLEGAHARASLATRLGADGRAADWTSFAAIAFRARGHGSFSVTLASGAGAQAELRVSRPFDAPLEWGQVVIPMDSLQRVGSGDGHPLAADAVSSLSFDIASPSPRASSVAWNGMLAPLASLRARGVLWYQGEADTGQPARYGTLLKRLVRDWRSTWSSPDLAFVVVQLPGYRPRPGERGAGGWAGLREAQRGVLSLPATAVVTTIDLGDANDIHPAGKPGFGERAALAAERVVYGKPVVASGPELENVDVRVGRLRLRVADTGRGLVARGGPPLVGFEVSADGNTFVPAKAVILDGTTIEVSSDAVPAPREVRYAWADDPACNLVDQAGLPAAPFRARVDAGGTP